MAFATTGRSDVRRRRVLIQSNGTPETPPASSSSSSAIEVGERRPYHEAAQRAFQPALTSLIPRRSLTHFFLACLGLSLGLFVLDAWVVTLEHPHVLRDLFFLSPTAPGSLMDWLVQGLCVAAAVTAGLIYLVRRHRVDDYRGRYRWWLWVAGCSLLASADATTHFSTQLTHVVARASGSGVFLSPSIAFLWPLFAGALLGAFLARELCESKFTVTLLLASASSMLATAVVMSGRLPISDPILAAMATASGRFLAVWLSLTGLLWYARHVDLAAHELLPAPTTRNHKQATEVGTSTERVTDKESARPRPKKTPKQKKKASPQTGDVEPEPATGPQAASKASKQDRVAASASHDSVESEEGAEDEHRGLSKAERRRLRKQKRRAARRNAA